MPCTCSCCRSIACSADAHRVRRDGHCRGQRRGVRDFSSGDRLVARRDERHHPRRTARGLRDGGRRPPVQMDGRAPPDVPHAVPRDCRAGGLVLGAGADRHLRHHRVARHLHGVDFLRRARARNAGAAAIGGLHARIPRRRFPVHTALFALMCLAIVVNQIVSDPRSSLWGLGLVVAGLPVYFLWRRVHAGDRLSQSLLPSEVHAGAAVGREQRQGDDRQRR